MVIRGYSYGVGVRGVIRVRVKIRVGVRGLLGLNFVSRVNKNITVFQKQKNLRWQRD